MLFVRAGGRPGSGLAGQAGAQPRANRRIQAGARRAAPLLLLALLAAGCGSKPQQAVGVSRGPVVHYLVCDGQLIEDVRLSTPAGRTLWEIHSDEGSTRTTYTVGETPPGFRQVTPFHGLAPVTRVSGPDGEPTLSFSHVPRTGILRGDGETVTPAQFAAGRKSYCGAVRQDRAAAFAVGFVFLVLLGLFLVRWVRAKRSRDPYDRPWK